jgi:hypothetical protein
MGLIAPFFIWLIFIKKQFLMSTILLNKNKFNILLKEANKNITGDKAAAAGARGEMASEKAKDIIRSMGVSVPRLDGIFSIPQLQVEPFKISFVIQDLTDNPQELTLPKTKEFNGLARVVKDPNNLTLEIKSGDDTYMMKFVDKDQLYATLPGTNKKIPALVTEQQEEGKFYTVIFNPNFGSVVKNEKEVDGDENDENDGKEGDEGKKDGEDKEGGKDVEDNVKENNYYNGGDLKEVNLKLSEIKDKSNFFSLIKQYKDDPDFQDIFLDAIISSTKSIKINKKPLLVTLKDLKNNGLLEEPNSMSGLKRKYLKVKLNLQNFMVDIFSLFAKLAKNGKQSKAFEVIKDFYKQLFLIASKGKSNISDKQTRKQLWKKLLGNFSNFLKVISKLPEMTKGGKKPEKGKEVKVKNTPKATMSTVEYYINKISDKTKIILEDDTKSGEGNTEAEIYLSSITLGPKAIKKRNSDIQATFGGGGGGKTTDLSIKNMEDKKFYNVNGKLSIEDVDKIPEEIRKIKEITNLINTVDNQKLKIRKSKDGQSVILGNRDVDEGVLIIKPKNNLINLVSGKSIPVTIGSNALGMGAGSFNGNLVLNLDK